MADEIEPTAEQQEETAPEVEAHSEQVLGLQGISIEEESREGLIAPGSCSSCAGSLCN
jgi:hypothetical protein